MKHRKVKRYLYIYTYIHKVEKYFFKDSPKVSRNCEICDDRARCRRFHRGTKKTVNWSIKAQPDSLHSRRKFFFHSIDLLPLFPLFHSVCVACRLVIPFTNFVTFISFSRTKKKFVIFKHCSTH